MLHTRILVSLLVGLLLVACGCSSRKPVKAIVTLDGKAVDGATVVLIKSGVGGTISGMSGPDGIVLLDSSTKDGIPPGDYKAVVTKFKATNTAPLDPTSPEAMKLMKAGSKPPKSELPEIYANASTTNLTFKVPPDTDPGKIELKTKP